MNLYVGNMSYDLSEDDLRKAFEAFGAVDSASIIKDKNSGQSKGFGFVEMSDDSQASAAIGGLNETDLKGRKLTVSKAKPRTDRPRTGGGGGYGGGGGGRY